MAGRTYFKVLSLYEGVHSETHFLLAPAASDHAVSHQNPLPHSVVQVEGDVPGSARYKVDAHSATHRPESTVTM